MEKIEFLESYQYALDKEKRIEEKIQTLRQRKMSAGAIKYTGMPHGTGTSDMSDYIVEIEEKIGTLAQTMRLSDKIADCICESLEGLIYDEYEILFELYINQKSVSQIEIETPYSQRTIYNRKNKGIENLHISNLQYRTVESILSKLETPA